MMDASLVTIAKTYECITTWMQVDRFGDFHRRSKDHHDFLHNGFNAMTRAVVKLKTLLTIGGNFAGVVANTPFPQEQKDLYYRPPTVSYQSVWNTTEVKEGQHSPVYFKSTAVYCPKTPMLNLKISIG
ncbi:MAG: hypothetical protein ACKPKO_41945, partial [Candidatus Fonsibacter sp.]